MPLLKILNEPALVLRAMSAVGGSQVEFGEALGVSRRTVTRWRCGDSSPQPSQWQEIARLVYPTDRALAADIATALGESLVMFGLESPAPPPAPPPPAQPAPAPAPRPPSRDLVDSVVCAAAEAIAMTPQTIRPALAAAFERVASLGLTLEEVRTGLTATRPRTSKA